MAFHIHPLHLATFPSNKAQAICEQRDTVSYKNVQVFYEYEVPEDDSY